MVSHGPPSPLPRPVVPERIIVTWAVTSAVPHLLIAVTSSGGILAGVLRPDASRLADEAADLMASQQAVPDAEALSLLRWIVQQAHALGLPEVQHTVRGDVSWLTRIGDPGEFTVMLEQAHETAEAVARELPPPAGSLRTAYVTPDRPARVNRFR